MSDILLVPCRIVILGTFEKKNVVKTMAPDDYNSITGDRVVPIYYGEYYLIGDTILRNQYELDKSKNENVRLLCNEQCSFWECTQNDRTEDAIETIETSDHDDDENALNGKSASRVELKVCRSRPFVKG